MTGPSRYARIIERIFLTRYQEGAREVPFEREDLERAAQELGVKLPKNLGDVVYSFRYRKALPESVRARAPEGTDWIIRAAGRALYRFVVSERATIVPNPMLAETKVPDATPGVIAKYAFEDEQALLAKLRYNRLVDIFTGVTCYSLQSHLRTSVSGLGQLEADEVYIGVDRRGAHYVFPIEAKGANETLGIVQIEQGLALCANRFASLICRPLAAQFASRGVIALFEFEESESGLAVSAERHYRLVPPEELTPADLEAYRTRPL